MSYELDNKIKYKCPCGRGHIIEANYSNDWFQYREEYEIECSNCCGKYHIETVGYTKPDGEYRSMPYLVPIGESLHYSSGGSYNIINTPFFEQLAMLNTKNDLEQAYEVLKNSKYYSRLEDSMAIKVCNQSKRVLKTVKIKTILPYVKESIDEYDNIECNYERNEIRIEKEKERVKITKEKSICLYQLDEI